jgi:hypothetical protein
MANLPNGSTVVLISGSQPASGCGLCRLPRRGTNESKTTGGTTCYARVAGGVEVCADCMQVLSDLKPA